MSKDVSLDEVLTVTKEQTDKTKKSLASAAFPGRTNAMGYTQGLSKLEAVSAQLFKYNRKEESLQEAVNMAVVAAAALIKACEEYK